MHPIMSLFLGRRVQVKRLVWNLEPKEHKQAVCICRRNGFSMHARSAINRPQAEAKKPQPKHNKAAVAKQVVAS